MATYTDISDPEFLGYDQQAKQLRKTISNKQPEYDSLKTQYTALANKGFSDNYINRYYNDLAKKTHTLDAELVSLSGQAATLETQRENRGATLTQAGANTQIDTAGSEAVKNENLLSQNINQEITGRIARNTQQAQDTVAGVNLLSEATRGRQAAKAGQAGYSGASGTAGALAAAASSKSAGDLAAIEDYRIAEQNLLMGQGEAATKSATSLSGTINTQTADWAAKSTSALTDVTGTLLKNVQQVADTPGFSGDINTPGVKASQAAVDTTLGTWSLKSYMDVLDTLTSHSANKSTWDQMLLEQAGTPTNPYSQFDTALTPLTPLAGTSSNLLAAAAGTPDNVYKNTGRLI